MKQPTLPGTMARVRVAQQPISRDGQLECWIPGVRLRSLNQSFRGASRGARMGAAAGARKQRENVDMTLRSLFGSGAIEGPLRVTVTRVHPGRGLDPHDNLPGACKHVVDAVARWLGRDDRDPSLRWEYYQRADGRTVGVGIRIERWEHEV